MTKGIETADARYAALRFAVRAIVDALADNKVITHADIIGRLRHQEEHLGHATETAELIEQLRDLRKFLA